MAIRKRKEKSDNNETQDTVKNKAMYFISSGE